MEPIDFVIMWVDGSDPAWLKEKSKFDKNIDMTFDNSSARYRDWDNLKYWFRGVEKFAPWVNRIHFVTWGHLPAWLDTTNPKLNVVNHKDFIPEEYLPTFNANTIELNLFRIKDLAEQFVFFNDDMFLIKETKPEDFYKNGLPRDSFALDVFKIGPGTAGSFNTCDLYLINKNFDFKTQLKKFNYSKYIRPCYGLKNNIKTRILSSWHYFTGFKFDHLATNMLKSTYEEIWEKEGDTLDLTCRDHIRNQHNVNQWLMKYWQYAKGTFSPRNNKFGKLFNLREFPNQAAISAIEKQQYKMVCINDTENTSFEDFEKFKKATDAAFEKILPEKSSFEKN